MKNNLQAQKEKEASQKLTLFSKKEQKKTTAKSEAGSEDEISTEKTAKEDGEEKTSKMKKIISKKPEVPQEVPLTDKQDQLLKKLIQFESINLEDSEGLKKELWNLFFDWQSSGNDSKDEEINQTTKKADLEEQELKKQEEKDEKKKRESLKLETAINEFQDRGGFTRVLNDIFNPPDLASMELDSVFQLKKLCKELYTRKSNISDELIQTLDALNNERPAVMQTKKRYFNIKDSETASYKESIDWMRLNAEKERIQKFKNIVTNAAGVYYQVIEKFSQMLTERKSEVVTRNEQEKDPSKIMQSGLIEVQIEKTVQYMTEYMRQIVESGQTFSSNHFMILLMQLRPQEIKLYLVDYINYLVQILKIDRREFDHFLKGLKNMSLKQVLVEVADSLFEVRERLSK